MHFRQHLQITFEEHEGNSQLRIIIGAFATVVVCLLCKVAVCPLCVHLKDVIMHLKDELIFCSTMTYFLLFKSWVFSRSLFSTVSVLIFQPLKLRTVIKLQVSPPFLPQEVKAVNQQHSGSPAIQEKSNEPYVMSP